MISKGFRERLKSDGYTIKFKKGTNDKVRKTRMEVVVKEEKTGDKLLGMPLEMFGELDVMIGTKMDNVSEELKEAFYLCITEIAKNCSSKLLIITGYADDVFFYNKGFGPMKEIPHYDKWKELFKGVLTADNIYAKELEPNGLMERLSLLEEIKKVVSEDRVKTPYIWEIRILDRINDQFNEIKITSTGDNGYLIVEEANNNEFLIGDRNELIKWLNDRKLNISLKIAN